MNFYFIVQEKGKISPSTRLYSVYESHNANFVRDWNYFLGIAL